MGTRYLVPDLVHGIISCQVFARSFFLVAYPTYYLGIFFFPSPSVDVTQLRCSLSRRALLPRPHYCGTRLDICREKT